MRAKILLATAACLAALSFPAAADEMTATVTSIDTATGQVRLHDRSYLTTDEKTKIEGTLEPGAIVVIDFTGDENGYTVRMVKVIGKDNKSIKVN